MKVRIIEEVGRCVMVNKKISQCTRFEYSAHGNGCIVHRDVEFDVCCFHDSEFHTDGDTHATI